MLLYVIINSSNIIISEPLKDLDQKFFGLADNMYNISISLLVEKI